MIILDPAWSIITFAKALLLGTFFLGDINAYN